MENIFLGYDLKEKVYTKVLLNFFITQTTRKICYSKESLYGLK